jgi:hypothetical protein
MIQVSFVHQTDSSQVLVATVAMDMPVAIIIERLIEAGFLNSQAWRGSYLLIDTGSGKMLRENDTFRTAKVSQRATINISHAATGG